MGGEWITSVLSTFNTTTEVRPLSKAPNPQLLPVGFTLLRVCALGWVKCRAQISLLVIFCIIVYVTNKKSSSLFSSRCVNKQEPLIRTFFPAFNHSALNMWTCPLTLYCHRVLQAPTERGHLNSTKHLWADSTDGEQSSWQHINSSSNILYNH